MWNVIAKYLIKAAVWCVKHPDEVNTIVTDVVAAKKAIAAAKS